MTQSIPNDLNTLAGEYVLGLLGPDEVALIEGRLARDKALAMAVAYWQGRLADLDDTATPATPAADLWPRIEASLAARPPILAPSRPSLLERAWSSLTLWRGFATAATAAVIGLAVVLGTAAPAPVVIAVLVSPDGTTTGAIVEAYADGSIKLVPITDILVPEGKALQVWTLWDRARGPVPLGLMQQGESVQLAAASLPVPQPEQLYEITLEPAAGSPTGRPTGPILYKGLAARPR